jgi:hypothetical protein
MSLALAVLAASWSPLTLDDSLDGWVKRGGDAVYRVENGEIIGQTRPNTPNTFLCTEREYADFELELEFKVDPALNSGIQFRSHSAPGVMNGRVWGYQAEIDPSDRAYTGGIYDEGIGSWIQDLSEKPDARAAFKKGDWNTYRIRAVGDRLQTWVNGVPAADATHQRSRSGFIALQVHGVGDRQDPLEVRWRNIRIREIGVASAMPANATPLMEGPEALAKWTRRGSNGGPAGWIWSDDAFQVVPGQGDIMTRQTWRDQEVYLEFMVDDNGASGQGNGNSGLYLQGRYEIQILNSAPRAPKDDECGGIYKVAAPAFAMAKPAGQWQSYHVIFRAPRWANGQKVQDAVITAWHNGVLIHSRQRVPDGTTAGVSEGLENGPILLQDHGNTIRFRRAWVREL